MTALLRAELNAARSLLQFIKDGGPISVNISLASDGDVAIEAPLSVAAIIEAIEAREKQLLAAIEAKMRGTLH